MSLTNAVPESVLDTLRRLSAMTVERGCTPAEAAGAAAKLEELLERWQLERFDVETNTYAEDVGEASIPLAGRRLPEWVSRLAAACARPHDVEPIMDKARDDTGTLRQTLQLVGHKSDVAVTAYLFETLSRLLVDMADRDGRLLGRSSHGLITFKNNFLCAAAGVIYERLWSERQKSRQGQATSTALVVVKEGAVKDYLAEHYPRLTNRPRSQQSDDHEARRRGRQAGAAVPLQKGVGREAQRPALS